MAPSNGGVSASTPGPLFSYAQAAKTKPTTTNSANSPPPKPPMSTRQSRESISSTHTNPATESKFSWAEDAADANTLVGNGTPRGSPNRTTPDDLDNTTSHPQPQDDLTPRHDSGTPAPKVDESLVDQLKEIEEPSQVSRSANDPDWRRRPSAPDNDAKQKASTATYPQNESENQKDKPEQKPLIAAPTPSVNVWTRRMQERLPKQNALPVQPDSSTASIPTKTGPKSGDAADSAQSSLRDHGMRETNAASRSQITAPKSSEKSNDEPSNRQADWKIEGPAQTKASNKTDRAISNRANATVEPGSACTPVVDSVNWPTPETAQDEERRKPGERSDRPEPESGPSHTSKAHGKQKWDHIPFVPTVKFETPMPPSRRGARGGGRGNRGFGDRGAISHAGASRSGLSIASADTSEGQTESVRRGRAGSTSVANSSIIRGRSSRRPASAHGGSYHHATQEPQIQLSESMSVPPGNGESAAGGKRLSQQIQTITTGVVNSNSEVLGTFPRSDDPKASGQSSDPPSANSRRRSIATQTDSFKESVEGASSSVRKKSISSATNAGEASVSRAVDRRRSGSNTHKSYWQDRRPEAPGRLHDIYNVFPRDRNDVRSERGRGGRGGRGGFAHAHAPAHLQLQTGSGTTQNSSPVSSSRGSSFQDFTSYPQSSRGYRPSPRSAPISTDSPHGRAMPNYPPTPQPSYSNGSYAYAPAQPVPTVQYDPYMQKMMLMNGIANQLNHYFSIDNLCKDVYLRKHMDSQGFVSLKFVAGFARMKQLTEDFEFIRSTVLQAPDLEMRNGYDGLPRIRRRTDWEKFVLKMEDREPSAQNDGPVAVNQHFSPFRGTETAAMLSSSFNGIPNYPAQANDLRSPQSQNFNNFAPMPTASPVSGPVHSPLNGFSSSTVESIPVYDTPQSQEQPPMSSATMKQNGSALDVPDAFPDEQIDRLTVISRVLNGGAADSSRPMQQRQGSFERNERLQSTQNGYSTEMRTDPCESNARESTISVKPHEICADNSHPNLFFLKGRQAPEPSPLGSGHEPYNLLRARALNGRITSSQSQSIYDINLLYMFWSHFLVSNFNTGMYEEFRRLALEDARCKIPTEGLPSLLKFYDDSLLSTQPARPKLAQDYVDLVRQESSSEDRPAFQHLRALVRNVALSPKHHEIIINSVDAQLRAELEK